MYNFTNENNVDLSIVRKMAQVLYHRGPDEEGYYFNKKIALGHKRLKIIDLDTGRQPIANEDGSLQIIFNGEIYNFKELRRNLLKQGHTFLTNTDTEVIVHLYEEYGLQCIHELRGMFAFALWDHHNDTLLLVRDRVGQKPLYYTVQNGVFAFASEIKALLEISYFNFALNNKAVRDYLSFSYVPPPQTIFLNVFKVLPAQFLVINKQGIKKELYWNLNFNNKLDISQQEFTHQIRNLLYEATAMRMVSDVPLGAFLSGGIDSSIIVALMNDISSQPIRTFSVAFPHKQYNESHYAQIIAKQFKTEHHQIIVKPDIINTLGKIVWYYDQPYSDSSSIATYHLVQHTRQHVTVALTGDGGDENFAGYQRYLAAKLFTAISSSPWIPTRYLGRLMHILISKLREGQISKGLIIKMKKFAQSLLNDNIPIYKNYHSWFCHFTDEHTQNLLTDSFKQSITKSDNDYLASFYEKTKGWDIVDRLLSLDINTYLPDDLLHKMDTATMAHSLEARSPFLDHKLMEFTAKIPARFKVNRFTTKYMLKQTVRDLLPRAIIHRTKMGFGVPVGEWMMQELQYYCKDLLLGKRIMNRGIFRNDYIKQLLDEHQSGKINHGNRIWNLIVFELWCRTFLDNEKPI